MKNNNNLSGTKRKYVLDLRMVSLITVLILLSATELRAEQVKKQPAKGFVENLGQIRDQDGKVNTNVKYLLSTNGLNVQLLGNSFSYDSYQAFYDKKKPQQGLWDSVVFRHIHYSFHRVDIEFIGANPNPQIIAENAGTDYTNYYNQGNTGRGITEVRHFAKVTYKNLYPGIDLEFITKPGSNKPVEYNFIVQPGADISTIRWRYNGSDGVSLEEGKVQIKTIHGLLTETIPHTFEKETGKTIELKYTTSNNVVFGFETKNYQPGKTVIIDPVPDLKWATYLGGTENDGYNGMCLDAAGNIFTTGCGNSFVGLATSGAYQVNGLGKVDGILSKYDPAGMLLWSTVFGGSEDDGAEARPATDAAGNIFITGLTASNGLATPGAYQTTWAGPAYSSYLAKFNGTGSLQWATYFDGNQQDMAASVGVDKNGNVLLTGRTNSDSGIASPGADQASLFGDNDMFLAKFTNSGTLSWSTYLGGGGSEGGTGVTSDMNGNIFITGSADNANGTAAGISTPGAQSYAGGAADMILAKYSPAGNKIWVTYFGGTLTEAAESIVADASGNIFIAGWSNSTGLAGAGAFQQSPGGGQCAVIVKYNTQGARLWSTYYGEDAFASGISVNGSGDVFICGATTGSNLIATPGAPKTTYSGGGFSIPPFPGFPGIFIAYYDGFVAKLSAAGALQWGTYFGSNMEDRAEDIAVDKKGNVYVSGYTASDSGITTPGAFQQVFAGGRNDCWLAAYEDLVGGNNASASEVTSPVPAFCAGIVPVKVEVINRGVNTISSFKVDWEMDGVRQTTVPVNTTLLPFGRTEVNLGSFNFPANTLKTLKIWTSMPNGVMDTVRDNDTILLNLKPGLNGVYTIGGNQPDYTTFARATEDLEHFGVCGAVNFEIRAGSYNEAVNLEYVKGSSAVNTISFSGAGADSVTLFYTTGISQNAVIVLKKARHLTFRNLTIRSDATVLDLTEADSNRFINLHLFTDSLQVVANVVNVNSSSSNIFDSLQVTWGGNGIRLEGDSGYDRNNTIRNSYFYDQALSGINALNQDGLRLHHNTTHGIKPLFSGIIVLGISNFEISANALYSGGFSGSELNLKHHNPAFRSLVVNNMISVTDQAIVLYDAKHIAIWHNSLQSLAQGTGLGVIEINHNLGGFDIRNNHIIKDNASGVSYLVYSGDTGKFTGFDYNNYFPSTAGFYIQSVVYNDVNALKAGLPSFNSNSYSSSPLFVSASDLHSSVRLPGAQLNIDRDIDGDYRCPQQPYVGADDTDHGFTPGFTLQEDSVYAGYTAHFLNNLVGDAVAKGLSFGWYVDDVKIADSVNLSHLFAAPGIYTIKLKVSSCALTDSVLLKVNVIAARPLLRLLGNNPDSIRVFDTYADPGVIAVNVLGLPITSIEIKNHPDSAVTGTYLVWYVAQDSLGNKDSVSRSVKVYDDINPELTLLGNDTISLDVFKDYTDPGILVKDNYCTNGKWSVYGHVDSSRTGIYMLTYYSTDCEGNTDSVKRWVIVRDNEAPVLKLNGTDTLIIDVFSTFSDPGASVTDNYCAGAVNINGTVNTAVLGEYLISYSSQDCEGNPAVVIKRLVKVVDRTAPVITLNGSLNISLARWQQFINPGFQLSDNYYSSSALTIDSIGNWTNSSEEGSFFIQYRVTDPSGNSTLSAKRFIEVSGTNSVTGYRDTEDISIYPNPGRGILTLRFSDVSVTEAHVIISDVTGKVVYQSPVNSQETTLLLEHLSPGIYQVKVVRGSVVYYLRVSVVN